MLGDGPFSRRIRRARVQALDRPGGSFYGGPVLGERPGGKRLRHTRRGAPVDSFAPALSDPAELRGSYAYLGLAFAHFGHIMAEMIHRVVPTRRIEADPHWLIVAERGAEASFDGLPSLCRAVLALFGIDALQCTVVASDTTVDELLIVEAGSDLGGGPKEWYLDLLRTSGPALVDPDDRYPAKVYVSRSGLGVESGLLGEHVLEGALEGAGFHIMHSEALPLAEQIAHYANAKVLLFAEGSACHGVELFGRGALGHTILMNRRDRARSQFVPVLEPRSTRFDAFTGNPYLGTVRINAEGVPLANRGVSAIAMTALAAFLSRIGAAELGPVSPIAYLAAAHDDLERYVAGSPGPESARLADDVRAALCAAIEAGGTIAPAVRRPRAR
jgi:hypothetical protein